MYHDSWLLCLFKTCKVEVKVLHLYTALSTLASKAAYNSITPSRELTQPWCESSPWGDWISEQSTLVLNAVLPYVFAGTHFTYPHRGMESWVNPQPGLVGSRYWTWNLLHDSSLLYQLSYPRRSILPLASQEVITSSYLKTTCAIRSVTRNNISFIYLYEIYIWYHMSYLSGGSFCIVQSVQEIHMKKISNV